MHAGTGTWQIETLYFKEDKKGIMFISRNAINPNVVRSAFATGLPSWLKPFFWFQRGVSPRFLYFRSMANLVFGIVALVVSRARGESPPGSWARDRVTA